MGQCRADQSAHREGTRRGHRGHGATFGRRPGDRGCRLDCPWSGGRRGEHRARLRAGEGHACGGQSRFQCLSLAHHARDDPRFERRAQAHGGGIQICRDADASEHGRPRFGAGGDGRALRRGAHFCPDHGDGRAHPAERFAFHPSSADFARAVGHDGRSEHLHGLQRVRRRLPGGEQRAHRGQRSGLARPQHGLDPHGPLLCRRRERPGNAFAGHHVPALRKCALRNGLPGQCHGAQRRRPQSHGLQPLHWHAVLREQLPVEGPALQFLRLQPASARPALPRASGQEGHGRQPENVEKSECHGAHAWGDGEVHLLHPAHRGGAHHANCAGGCVGQIARAVPRGEERLPASVSFAIDRFRQHPGSGEPRGQAQERAAQL